MTVVERLRRLQPDLTIRGLLIDVAIAIGLTVASLFAVFAGAPDLGPDGLLNLTLLLLQSVPLAIRRIVPVPVFLIVFGSIIIQLLILPPGSELRAGGGPLVAVYTLGERLERRMALPLLVGGLVIVGVLLVAHTGFPAGIQPLIQTELFFAAAWFVGDSVRTRHLYTKSLERTTELLAQERLERERRAIADERERIAREMHDAVTHHVSVIVIQAGAALRAQERRPEDVRTALEAIDTTARHALTDMRRMLGVLGEGETLAPMPRLDRLGDLIEQVRLAGLAVELSLQGQQRALDPGLELSAYRIIQEALTNSLKHAGGGRAHVTVRYGPTSLHIAVVDERGSEPLPAVEPAHQGRGLLGMRERVAMLRGSFAAEPTASGFSVTADLPIDAGASAS